MQNIENKVIIITGASSGIGEETAKVLAKMGQRSPFPQDVRTGFKSWLMRLAKMPYI